MRIFFIMLLLLSIGSCTPEGRVFEEHKELSPDVEWLGKDKREFTVHISETEQAYSLGLSFRYANGYPYEELRVHVIEIDPDGNENPEEFTLKIRNEQGEYVGEAGYDIWDSEHIIVPTKTYGKKGKYRYIVTHAMPKDPVYYAMEIGLFLDEMK